MGTLKENLKKIGRIGKELLLKYWWVGILFYTIKGIAALLFIHFILNA
jgi:hypothetical protein